MMKNIYITIFCFIFFGCKSAVSNTVVGLNNEVLFVLFEESNNTKKMINPRTNNKEKLEGYLYTYDFSKDNGYNFFLDHSAYFSLDDMFHKTNRSKVLKINEKFLTNNFIVTNDYIKKIGDKASFELFYKSKMIFVIDKSEIKNNIIILREVKPTFTTEE